MKKLNLGCGTDIRKGWINLDIAKIPGVDIVYDINKLPIPFKNEVFDYILCNDVLEHVEYVPLMKELHRILKEYGIIEIKVPHFSSRNNFVDPTHKKFFSFQTFEFFVKNSTYNQDYNKEYYFDFHFKEVVYSKIFFSKGLFIFNFIVEPFVNCCEMSKKLFELTFLSRLFPAENIIIKIKK